MSEMGEVREKLERFIRQNENLVCTNAEDGRYGEAATYSERAYVLRQFGAMLGFWRNPRLGSTEGEA